MWHSSTLILNMQLLFGILTSLKTYKNLNLFSVLHAGSVPKDATMAIVTRCTPWTYPHFLKWENLKMCHLYKIVHGFLNAPLAYMPCTNHFTRHTFSQPSTTPELHKHFLYLLFPPCFLFFLFVCLFFLFFALFVIIWLSRWMHKKIILNN